MFLCLFEVLIRNRFVFSIKRNCRYALVPQPVSASVVRNFTTLAYPFGEIQKAKQDLKEEDYVKDFLKVELPALDTIEEIDESFRQHLFAQWVMNDKKENFQELKTKLKTFSDETVIKHKEYLDPTNFELVNAKVGDLLTEVDFNKTHAVKFVVPKALRKVLFKGWEDKGYSFVRLLSHYGETKMINKQ